MEWVWEVGIREYPPVPDDKPEAANVRLPASEVPMLLSDWLSGTGSNKSLMNQAMRPPMRVLLRTPNLMRFQGSFEFSTWLIYQILQFHLTNGTPIGNDRLGRPGTTIYIAQVMQICLV
jgi:hypothetical protein